jgi:hypothetical protein
MMRRPISFHVAAMPADMSEDTSGNAIASAADMTPLIHIAA